MSNVEQIICKMPDEIKYYIDKMPSDIKNEIEEIRIQIGQPLRIISRNKEIVLNNNIGKDQFDVLINALLNYSIYAYGEELKNGYITIEGGHRVGICGKAVLEQNNVKTLKEFSSINIRRSQAFPGICEKIIDAILDNDSEIQNTIIVSPPKCGKTTLLRDIVRYLSITGFRVGLCDERSEIAGMFQGVPSYDLGPRTDVLDCCPKAEGMIMLIRSMAPDVLITDEIGKDEDIKAIESVLCSGVKIITTIHGNDFTTLKESKLYHLIENHSFSRIIYLSNNPSTGSIKEVQYV